MHSYFAGCLLNVLTQFRMRIYINSDRYYAYAEGIYCVNEQFLKKCSFRKANCLEINEQVFLCFPELMLRYEIDTDPDLPRK